ncbi:hypothetical protein QN277_010819 [Acacia crassicarpa]|uniref:Uncharacterized protein n=1 Tax=Acacia crassicarpa TaxID=499986 RepID=A0AAE1IN44_9FABA|nr:hypothetical protein QN277_010819 [Acacia crassicarpa]
MASPSSSFSNTDTIASGSVSVSQNEFNQFHSIDRILFTRLLVSLGREANEAMQVMAYLIWLEKMSRDFRLVSKLLDASDFLLHELVNEVVLALVCIETDQFPRDSNVLKDLRLTQSVTHTSITIPYLLQNRVAIIQAITKIINDVCIKAFTDIVQKVEGEKAEIKRSLMNPMVQPVYFDCTDHVVPRHNNTIANWCRYEPESNHHQVMVSDVLKGSELMSTSGARRNVPPDERTIFLTFSKGYPISEAEVRDYFSRRYGDMIEEVYMQEAGMLEQALYARLVVRGNATHLIESVLEGKGKVKFSINGKHVWARKYVRKTTKSPPTSPSLSPFLL